MQIKLLTHQVHKKPMKATTAIIDLIEIKSSL